jgi:hypothetical protein
MPFWRSGAPARLLSTANLLHQAIFDEAARPALATDPLPASPPDMGNCSVRWAWPQSTICFSSHPPLANPALRPTTSVPLSNPQRDLYMIELSNHRKAPFYPFFVGDVQFCIISDGTLDLGSPRNVFIGEPEHNVDEALTKSFLPTEQIVIDQNVLSRRLSASCRAVARKPTTEFCGRP